MDTIGLDLHKRESQLCIIGEDGSVSERRIVTSRERFTAVLGNRAPARIILEASTESEWVAQHLESLGHEVVVADPNYAPMYATRARRVKTDKRDARALADALKLGAYRNAHRLSAERRHVRAELAVREALVRTRTRYVSVAKALVRRDGLRVAGSEAEKVALRIAELDLSDTLASELMPLFQVLVPINDQIAGADRRIVQVSKTDPEVALLTTAPSIGPVTSAAIVATVDDITRFDSAHQFEAFLGLVPGERSSGEKRRVGKITKAGNSRGTLPVGRSRMANHEIQERGYGGASHLGTPGRSTPWKADRCRRVGTPSCRDSLRDVERQFTVYRRESSHASTDSGQGELIGNCSNLWQTV